MRPANESGFTLIELLIAITLVGILTAVAVVGLTGLTSTSNKSACSAVFSAAQSAATTYYANTGAYPKTVAPAPFGFSLLTSGSPPLLTLPAGFTVTGGGNTLTSSTGTVTIAGGGSNTPNTYTKTGSCS